MSLLKSTFTKVLTSCVVAGMYISSGYAAEVNWDFPISWPENNFHTVNATKFASEVEKSTNGEVIITIHPNGSLGFKGPEMLTSVEQGLVPIADIVMSAQSGIAPILALDTLPYLVNDIDQLQILYKHWRPAVEKAAAKHNQKVLYMVPWPPAMIYTKSQVNSIDDLKGVKVRTYSKSSSEMMNSLGMTAIQMPWGELIPALASGAVESVTTSAASGVDGKLWEYLDYMYVTSHTWSTNMVTVNLDAWNALSDAQRSTIDELAQKLEPVFIENALSDHIAKLNTLQSNGIELGTISPDTLENMKTLTAPLVEKYVNEVGAPASDVLKKYRTEVNG
ncbi:TRAP transporter substrate-binding protein [Sneathiella sp. CAU 1612]|uniref:TRAP transporter substrate-binding protein n=1 Tax=Sneathiella sedimenti TaxID=2816034 RepID=A0ABS3F9F1_9PROT|nr:TRAP transporter substrate-binding protein [Sneathiella sedimenti]MBO0334721.1 TRAP transporter substrate-binding protein [Sneathiella sedimenti]